MLYTPWKYDPSNDPNPNIPYRETQLKVWKGSGPTQIVTIRQWKPILIKAESPSSNNLYMERFEEEGNSMAWDFNGDPLTATRSTLSFIFNGSEVNGWNNTLYLNNKSGTPTLLQPDCV